MEARKAGVMMMMVVAAIILLLLSACLVKAGEAGEVITKTFAWDEPEDLEKIDRWEMHYSSSPGGPYTFLANIPRDGDYRESVMIDIIGAPGTEQERYFILRACGDQPVTGGGVTEYQCSGDSNEVAVAVWIPANEFRVPVNFRIIPQEEE